MAPEWQKNLLTTGYIRANVKIHFTSIFIKLLNVVCPTTVILNTQSVKSIPDLTAICAERHLPIATVQRVMLLTLFAPMQSEKSRDIPLSYKNPKSVVTSHYIRDSAQVSDYSILSMSVSNNLCGVLLHKYHVQNVQNNLKIAKKTLRRVEV